MQFKKAALAIGLNLTPEMSIQFESYYQFLTKQNEVMNLTAITDKEEVYTKHFLDSIHLTKAGDFENASLLDVSSGAGFPSIPLKIVCPKAKITIVDATMKRIDFLTQLSAKLGISDNQLIHGRIEDFKKKNSFDFVTARAVAKLNILTELCLPFVKVGGLFIAMKSTHYEEELVEAFPSIHELGGQFREVILYPLDDDLSHALIIIEKMRKTSDEYPRTFAQIKKKPL